MIDDWSVDGDNLLWKADFTGRSTPVVVGGRVYVIGRVGDGVDKQERVVSFDAESGRLLWQHRFNVFLTTVPFPRVGWASLAADPDSGNVYAHGAAGTLICLDRDGKVLWERSLAEELGRMSGYGGRTHTPVIAGDLVILGVINNGWGEQAVPRHRYFAFDKRGGEIVWVSTPGGRPYDLNTYSTPVVAEIDGQQLLIGGNADGAVYALRVQTGEKVWGFKLSKRGINSSVVVEGHRVCVSHSEENLDEATMGRLVCIDGRGRGDVTETHELWRHNQSKAGFASPTIYQGQVYVIDNSANLDSLDITTGKAQWTYNLGTVGKGSPVWADGKLYTPELNGTLHILKPGSAAPTSLSKVTIELDNRTAEIYGSPAISNGRIYFATEEGIYCLGRKDAPRRSDDAAARSPLAKAPPGASTVHLQVVPSEVVARVGEQLQFRTLGYDAEGRLIGESQADWSLQGLQGRVDGNGSYRSEGSSPDFGKVVARVGDLESAARVRIWPELPWEEDFEAVEVGKSPPYWIGSANRFSVKLVDDNNVLSKPFVRRGIQRSYVYIGPSDLTNYTVQADLLGSREGRRVPDMGVISNRYILALMGRRQQLHVHSWASELRMAESVDFSWDPNAWYRMKMSVEVAEDKATIRGKVWPREQPEPGMWNIVVEDPHPNRQGTPGLFGQSYAEILYDNIKVIPSEP